MKKFLMFLCAVMMVFGMVGSASAINFTNTKNLNIWLGDDGQDSGTYEWTQNTPLDFEVPFDVVNFATLEITASYVDWNNETVDVQGLTQGTLVDGTWSWSSSTDWTGSTEFNIADVFVTWDAGNPLNVALNYTEWPSNNALYLDTSTFTLDYDNRTTPVPEPSTILLLGAGLLGLVGYNRKRFSKKS